MELYKYFNQYNKLFYLFLLFFNEILKLEISDKLSFYQNPNLINTDMPIINYNNLNFFIKIDKYHFFQPINRYINKQSKSITFYYLNLLFKEYNLVLENLLNDNTNHGNNNYLIYIIFKYRKMNDELIISLEKLKITYNNYNINNIVNKYITILIKI
jgi:hypothetical protein